MRTRRLWAALVALPIILGSPLEAAKLLPRTGAEAFAPAAISGDTAIVGAYGVYADGYAGSGALYIYRNLSEAASVEYESVSLVPAGTGAQAYVGRSVALSGGTALVGAIGAAAEMRGAAYLYRNVLMGGAGTHDAKLLASESERNTYLGFSSALSTDGGTAVLGGYGATMGGKVSAGAAYVYRGLGSGSGDKFENAVLAASNAAADAQFGYSVAMSANGGTALVGANTAIVAGQSRAGAAYLYLNLAGASGTVANSSTESAMLVAGDAAANMLFGNAVALSEDGGTAIVGAHQAANGGLEYAGAVYVYRNLGAASGTKTQDAKLAPSDVQSWAQFGNSVALSGKTALVGARNGQMNGYTTGTAHLYLDVTGGGPVLTDDVKIAASDAAEHFAFGHTVSLDGDHFVIGACTTATDDIVHGRAYTASVSALTTLDTGGGVRRINGISFKSQRDWVVGKTKSSNTVVLGWEDTSIINGGKVYIGETDTAMDNLLVIDGTLVAGKVYIGTPGNAGNALEIGEYANIENLGNIYLAGGNALIFDQPWTEKAELFDFLGDTVLWAWDGNDFKKVTSTNFLRYVKVEHGAPGDPACMIVTLVSLTIDPAKITDMTVTGSTVKIGGELWSATIDETTGKLVPGAPVYMSGHFAIFSAPELSETAVWTYIQNSAGDIFPDGTFTKTIAKVAGADERFYRVATSNLPFDANTGETEGAVCYSWNVSAYYTLQLPNGLRMFYTNHLEQTAGDTAAALFASVEASLRVEYTRDDGSLAFMSLNGMGKWTNGSERIPMGQDFQIINSQGFRIDVVLAGVLNSGKYEKDIPLRKHKFFSSVIPIAGKSSELGVATVSNMNISKMGMDGALTYASVPSLRTVWTPAEPVLRLGESFELYYPSAKTLVQEVWIDPTLLEGALHINLRLQ